MLKVDLEALYILEVDVKAEPRRCGRKWGSVGSYAGSACVYADRGGCVIVSQELWGVSGSKEPPAWEMQLVWLVGESLASLEIHILLFLPPR